MQRVKILYEKRDNALIQMSDPNQSQLGMRQNVVVVVDVVDVVAVCQLLRFSR